MPIDKNSHKYKDMVSDFALIAKARKEMLNTGLMRGSVECPKCGGYLNWEKHSNGHIWARCEKQDCIGWME